MSAILASLSPNHGSFAGVVPGAGGYPPLIGQVQYAQGERSARLCYLLPLDAADAPGFPELLDTLARKAGEWGAFNLLAELDEHSPLFVVLRQAGFAVYAWQRICSLLDPQEEGRAYSGCWQPVWSEDEIAIRSLYQNLVPPLVQSAEALISQRRQGFVYRQDGDVLGYIEVTYGPHGIYLYPLIHPTVEGVAACLKGLLIHLEPLLGRPVYLTVPSYQPWLETALVDLQQEEAPRQALMVKHLAQVQRVLQPLPLHARIEKQQPEATVPMVHHMANPHENGG
ncbi:MAG: hypothetical protein GYA59_12420 [Chloroflexi bacterium]|nr:hypothetical protein [Chloroflexota bacterium]